MSSQGILNGAFNLTYMIFTIFLVIIGTGLFTISCYIREAREKMSIHKRTSIDDYNTIITEEAKKIKDKKLKNKTLTTKDKM